MLRYAMDDFTSVVRNAPSRDCATFNRLTDYHGHYLQALHDFLKEKGFEHFNFLGSGSNCMVVAPKDNPSIVMRFYAFPGDNRMTAPPMLQPIGQPVRIGAETEEGVLRGGYELEFLKRLDMQVSRDALNGFLHEIADLGYQQQSLRRGSEIGWYSIGDKRVLMGADSSSIGIGQALRGCALPELPCPKNYPDLKAQYHENLRLISEDSRLGFLKHDVEKQLAKLAGTKVGKAIQCSFTRVEAVSYQGMVKDLIFRIR